MTSETPQLSRILIIVLVVGVEIIVGVVEKMDGPIVSAVHPVAVPIRLWPNRLRWFWNVRRPPPDPGNQSRTA